MKTKTLPSIFMLLGGAVAVICTYINGYSLTEMLKILLIALVVFLIIGLIAKAIIDKYVPYIEETEEEIAPDEGSVIEKTGDETSSDEYDDENDVIDEGEFEEE